MKIIVESISKRYTRPWIIKDFDFVFESGSRYAITGHNGAGKSTLLKILSTKLQASKGRLHYSINSDDIPAQEVYKHLSFAAPYIDLIEEYNLKEMLQFHFSFKKSIEGVSQNMIIESLDMKADSSKYLKDFSSGMKQKVKLALSIFSDSDLLILDEPTTNLDESNKQWFREIIEQYHSNRTIIIASNDQGDFMHESIPLKID